MQAVERLDKFRDESFDTIILKIKRGDIKCGRYAHLVKIDKNKIYGGKELFTNANADKSK